MLEDVRVPVRLKLAGLWTSVMFCYVYGDYIELYQPGKLTNLLAGRTPMGPVSQEVLMGIAVTMAIPSLMVALSLVLPAQVSRWSNIVFGVLYSAIMVMVLRGGWHFYVFLAVVEIALTITVVVVASRWPKLEKVHEA